MLRKSWNGWWKFFDKFDHEPYCEYDTWFIVGLAMLGSVFGGGFASIVVAHLTNDLLGWITWGIIFIFCMLVLVSVEESWRFCTRNGGRNDNS